MSRHDNSVKLLQALTNVSDNYIQEAISFADRGADAAREDLAGADAAGHRIVPLKRIAKFMSAAAACFILIFAGYNIINSNMTGNPGDTDGDTANLGGGNPTDTASVQEVADIDEAATITGFSITVPDAEEPYTNMAVTVTDKSAIEVAYMNDDSTDTSYSVSKTEGKSGISGDNTEYSKTADKKADNNDVTLKGDSEGWAQATWSAGGYSYSIAAYEHPMTTDKILSLVKQIK